MTGDGDNEREDGPHPKDVVVGLRIKVRRTELGLSQEKLGERVKITFQQVQKYERGINRVSASRLSDIAEVLGVPITYFFNRDNALAMAEIDEIGNAALEVESGLREQLARPETHDLVRAYWRIPTASARRSIYDLTRSLGSAAAPPPSVDDYPEQG